MGAARRNRARRRSARWGLENATATTTRVRAWRGLGELTELGNRRRCGAEGAGDEARAAALGRGRRQVQARGLRTSGRRGSMRGVSCEVGRWVRAGQKSPAASNSGESRIYRSWGSGAIPRKLGSILRSGGSESFWTSRRGGCAAWPELRCVGAAWQQRHRGAAARRGELGHGVLWLRK